MKSPFLLNSSPYNYNQIPDTFTVNRARALLPYGFKMDDDNVVLIGTDGEAGYFTSLDPIFDDHGSLVDNQEGLGGYHSQNVARLQRKTYNHLSLEANNIHPVTDSAVVNIKLFH